MDEYNRGLEVTKRLKEVGTILIAISAISVICAFIFAMALCCCNIKHLEYILLFIWIIFFCVIIACIMAAIAFIYDNKYGYETSKYIEIINAITNKEGRVTEVYTGDDFINIKILCGDKLKTYYLSCSVKDDDSIGINDDVTVIEFCQNKALIHLPAKDRKEVHVEIV